MSRRLELTVPNEWALPIRDILQDKDKCNLGPKGGKPAMIVELPGVMNTVFLVTIPGPSVGTILEVLRKNGVGSSVGRIILSSVEYLKPDLAKPLTKADLTPENMKDEVNKTVAKATPLKGIQHFQRARKTTEEMYNEISNGANISINVWMNLIGASVMAAGGLITNVLVFIVAAMLVSPIMGPILGMVMGYRVADFSLFKTGFLNEMKMALAAYLIGALFGLVLGDVGNTYKWPNDQMMSEGQAFNLVISILVSAAAGTVLGVSLTSTGGNALVGTAISAGLLPPLVNAGMLMAYALAYCNGNKDKQTLFYNTGTYSILFYFTHVITIVIVANFVFWLKDIDPRFREGEDSNFNDIPTLVMHKRRLEARGKTLTEREKAEYFFENVKEDLKKDFKGFTDNLKGFLGVAGDGSSNTATQQRRRKQQVKRQRRMSSRRAGIEQLRRDLAALIAKRDQLQLKKKGQQQQGGEEEGEEVTEQSPLHMREEEEEKERQHLETAIVVARQELSRLEQLARQEEAAEREEVEEGEEEGEEDEEDEDLAEEDGEGAGDIEMGSSSAVSRRGSRKLSQLFPRLSSSSRSGGGYAMVSNPMFASSQQPANKGKTAASSTAASSEQQAALREAIYDFYRQYNPSKLSELSSILRRYEGQEADLLDKLHRQYRIPYHKVTTTSASS